MDIKSVKSALLSTSSGKLVSVQNTLRPRASHQLVAQNKQTYCPEVNVYEISYGNRECMAFGFEVENKSVFPVVTEDKKGNFKVLPKEEPITERTFDESFLFQWGEGDISGKWRSLESVAEPKKYLHVEKKGKVTFTEEKTPDFFIDYLNEKKEKKSQSRSGSVTIQDNEINRWKKLSWERRSLKRGPSCSEGSNKGLHCHDRKAKRMKMSVKS